MRKILKYTLIIIILTSSNYAHAKGACISESGEGISSQWSLKIKNNSTDHNYKKKISIPLVIPEINIVDVGEYKVLVKKEKKSGPPPMFGDALEAAFIAASRPPNKLIEYLNGNVGNEEFHKTCMKHIANDMKNNKLLGKKIAFIPFNETNDKNTSGEKWRSLSTCYIDGKNSKKIEVIIRGTTTKREIRKNKKSAGKMNVDFSVSSSGTINPVPAIKANFIVTSKEPTAINTPTGSDKAVKIKMAFLKSKVEEEIKSIQTKLNNLSLSLTESEQASLCKGDRGEIDKSVEFKAFNKTYKTKLIITAKKNLVINNQLGENPFCKKIDCDCDNIRAGLLTRHWISACKGEESSAKKRCQNDGKIHKCVMVGPSPYYPSIKIPSNLRVE